MSELRNLTVVTNSARAADYAPRICAAWNRAFAAIIETGRLLLHAKAALPHGEWGKLFDRRLLPFDRRAAQCLMQIASDPRMRTNGSHLPPCWRTLVELSRLSDTDFKTGIRSGEINPMMTRADVQVFRTTQHYQRQNPRSDITDDLGRLVAEGRTYGCILADPPWPYTAKVDGAAIGHYRTMTLDDICALPVREVAADICHLFLWVPAPFLQKAFAVMEAWGFGYKSQWIWCKHAPAHGSYWTITHENLLLGTRGNITAFPIKGIGSWQEIKKGRHSQKPEQVRAMIERVSPNPRLELFGREPVSGWTVCGDEV
jgi:N6-adenosine-specific RNA methylase IME4